ncbi:MAG: hypothetical protein RIS79_3155 [Verrucomicrobiota bacterium]
MNPSRPHTARFRPQYGIQAFMFVILTFLLPPSAQSAVVYSGIQNLSVSQDFGGLYLNVTLPGFSTNGGTEPASWASAPWINPFFGGVSIGNSALLRPNTDGAGRDLKVAIGTVIDSSRTYATGEAGSTTHVGAGADQFQLGAQGLLAFVMQETIGGPNLYGWMRVIIKNTGAGTIVDWAYENSGASIQAGQFNATQLIPEPSRMFLLLGGLQSLALRRRRKDGHGQ